MARKNVQAERKQQILEALCRCLLQKPFQQTSIKDIAKEAGVNHGVLHYYFKNKDDILLQFIDYILERYKGYLSEIITRHENFSTAELIDMIFQVKYEKFILDQDLTKLFIEAWALANHNPMVKAKLQTVFREWEKMIEGLIVQSGIDAELAHTASVSLISFFEGLGIYSVMLSMQPDELPQVLDNYKQQIKELLRLQS